MLAHLGFRNKPISDHLHEPERAVARSGWVKRGPTKCSTNAMQFTVILKSRVIKRCRNECGEQPLLDEQAAGKEPARETQTGQMYTQCSPVYRCSVHGTVPNELGRYPHWTVCKTHTKKDND